MAPERSGVLIIEDGAHQAGRAVLARGRYLVGSSADNDIIISDLPGPGVAFTLHHRGRDIMLYADAAVEISDRKPLAPGQSARCVSSVRFTSGGINLRLEIAATVSTAETDHARRRIEWRVPTIAGVLVAAIMFVSLTSFRTVSPTTRPDDAVELTASISPATGGVLSDSKQEFALERLRQHLAADDLGSLAVTARPDGSIEARGQISKAQEAAWSEVGHWFDSLAGGQAVLVDAVTVAAEVQPLAVQAVWPGPNPYVMDGSGDKLFVGSALAGGWTISSIDRSHVLITRGDESLSVRF
jgi:type III secretion system (T3SS) inner membrane Yop/CscD-like protein